MGLHGETPGQTQTKQNRKGLTQVMFGVGGSLTWRLGWLEGKSHQVLRPLLSSLSTKRPSTVLPHTESAWNLKLGGLCLERVRLSVLPVLYTCGAVTAVGLDLS